MNIFQQRTLEALAEFAANFDCIETVYLFGSAARGDTANANDIDIYFEYTADISSNQQVISFQDKLAEWQIAASERLGRRVKPDCTWYGCQTHDIWKKIQGTAITARIGKAAMVGTPELK